jgi:hypothetical protein
MKAIVNYYTFNLDSDEIVVIMEDGGVASNVCEDNIMRSEYYQDRMTKDVELDNLWDVLGEGKMYCHDWEDKNPTKKELIDDMIGWLYVATKECEFVQNDMGELNEESFSKVKALLKL